MTGVRIKAAESFENALRRFKNSVKKPEFYRKSGSGNITKNPSVKRKKKALAAKKRALRRMRKFES